MRLYHSKRNATKTGRDSNWIKKGTRHRETNVAKSDDLSQFPGSTHWREEIPSVCPVTSTYVRQQDCMFSLSHTIIANNDKNIIINNNKNKDGLVLRCIYCFCCGQDFSFQYPHHVVHSSLILHLQGDQCF